MSYVTVFEITHDSSLSWWPFLVLPLANGLIGTVILLLTRNLGSTTKLVRSFVFLYACLLVVLLAYNFRNRSRYVQAYRSGKYAVVEGPVERYSWNVFSVHDLEFCRGTGNPDQLAWPGWPHSKRLARARRVFRDGKVSEDSSAQNRP